MIAQNMQPPTNQHPNILISLVGITNQDTANKGPPQTIRLCCSKCRFSTKDHDLFERHLAQHEGVTFTCRICGHISYTKVEAQRHTVQHSGRFPFRCEFCGYGAVRRDYVVKHVQRLHAKRSIAPSQDKPQNVLIMGDVSVASIPKVGLSTLIDVTEQTAKASSQPINIVSNWIPLTVNQPQSSSTSQLGSVLNKQIGIIPNRLPSPQGQYLGVTSNRDSLSTNLNSAGSPSKLISITPVRPPNGANCANINVTSNNNLSAGSKLTSSAGKVLTSLTQTTSFAPNAISIIPSQTIHMATPNTSNTAEHSVHQTPSIILRKTQQNSMGMASNATNKICPAESQPTSSAGKILTNLNPSASVAAKMISVMPNQAIHLAMPNTPNTRKNLVRRTPPNILRKTQQTSIGTERKPLYVSSSGFINQASVGSSNKTPNTGSQALLSASNMTPVSANQTAKPTLNTVSNLPGKMVNLASNRPLAIAKGFLGSPTNRNANTVTQSLGPQNTTIESQMGIKTTMTSLQSRVTLGLQGKHLSDINIKSGSSSPVQVELLEPLNQPILHNRTLTVSYPEEMSIPPGSLVELVKVKTVNGAQELQFRIVQQTVGCSDRNTSNTAAAVDPSLKDGPPAVGQVGSWNKRASNIETSCEPTPSLNTHNEMGVTVKEEPLEHHTFFTPSSQLTNSASNVSCLPAAVLTERKKDQSYSSHSLLPLLHNNKLPATTPQKQNSDGCVRDCQASESAVAKQVDCNGDVGTEGLPVILSVYSLGSSPESEQFSPLDEGPSDDNSANNHDTCTPCKDSVNNILDPCPSSVVETQSQLLQHEGDFVMPPGEKRAVDVPASEKCIQGSVSGNWESVVSNQAFANSGQTDAANGSTDCHLNPRVDSTGHKQVKVYPPLLQNSLCPTDTEAKERTNCNVQISGFTQKSYEQLFTLVPKVSLVRISNTHVQPAVHLRKLEKNTVDVTLTARSVLSCASYKPNISLQHCQQVLKLRLKRKKCETENDSSDMFEAFPAPFSQANFKPFDFPKERQRKEKVSGKRRKVSGIVVSQRLFLTPVKEDQSVKCPGPNQPVVVLNHPHPPSQKLGRGTQSPADGRGVAPLRIVFSRDTHRIVPEIVKSPTLKMKFKKVDGNQYQVTELVAEGISDKLVL